MATLAQRKASQVAARAKQAKLEQRNAIGTSKNAIEKQKARLRNQTSVIQSKLGSKGLGEKTIKAQQDLAEKFGIVTFDVLGNISTIPLTRKIDKSIDVGTGRFTSNAFRESINTITENLVGTPTLGGITGFFADNISKPINDFIDSIFSNQDIDELPTAAREKVLILDTEINTLEDEISVIEIDFNLAVKRFRGNPNSLVNLTRQKGFKVKSIRDKIIILKAKRDEIFKEFLTATKVTDEVKRLIDEMNKVLLTENITIQLKQNAAELVSKGSAVIEKMLVDGVTVQQETITELQRGILGLVQLQKESITEKKTELGFGLDFIKEGLFGFGTALSEAFEKLANPDVNTYKDMFIKIAIGQRLAAQELAQQ